MLEKPPVLAELGIKSPLGRKLKALADAFLLPLVLSAIAVAGTAFSYLFFHVFAELFSIVIASTALIVVATSRRFTKNNYLVFVASLIGWCAVVDLLHMVTYKGMTLTPFQSSNTATQFWVLARSLQAAGLLLAPYYLRRELSFARLHAALALLVGLGVASIGYGWFPDCYVEGQGLTAFKIYTEYAIIVVLAASGWRLWRNRQSMPRPLLWGMTAAIFTMMLSEFALTLYVDINAPANLLGHVLKFFAYWFIYLALIETTLRKPFEMLASAANTYDAVPDPTLVVSADGIILEANRAAAMLVGSTAEQLRGSSSHLLFHDAQLPQEKCPVCNALLKSRERFVMDILVKHGARTIECNVAPLLGQREQDLFVQLLRDTTAQKAVEAERDRLLEQLRRQQARA
ncbi:MAG: MASE3 domain-containing protein [Polaromonas sp.]|uniref:MASE3 domain-containing protein n=1 Tax=Polaromonas sp. TaxID=1869339 RepID=UPI00248981D8|nr:MASE3 domain-containing protein [Polaromonas sp.]MDI1270119.1 MASE3 domain-containing protein [Polaromonas sp.]